jgi:hypothetical protein
MHHLITSRIIRVPFNKLLWRAVLLISRVDFNFVIKYIADYFKVLLYGVTVEHMCITAIGIYRVLIETCLFIAVMRYGSYGLL